MMSKKLSEILEIGLTHYGNAEGKSAYLCRCLTLARDREQLSEEETELGIDYISEIIDGCGLLTGFLVLKRRWIVEAAFNSSLRKRWYLKRIAELKVQGK